MKKQTAKRGINTKRLFERADAFKENYAPLVAVALEGMKEISLHKDCTHPLAYQNRFSCEDSVSKILGKTFKTIVEAREPSILCIHDRTDGRYLGDGIFIAKRLTQYLSEVDPVINSLLHKPADLTAKEQIILEGKVALETIVENFATDFLPLLKDIVTYHDERVKTRQATAEFRVLSRVAKGQNEALTA